MGERGEEILVDGIAFAIDALLLVHLHFEARALFIRVGQLAEAVGEFYAAGIKLEAFRHARVVPAGARQGRLAARIFDQDRRAFQAEARFEPLAKAARKR